MRSNKGKSISAIIHQADKRSGIKETVRHLCDIGNQITCLVMFFTGMQDLWLAIHEHADDLYWARQNIIDCVVYFSLGGSPL